MSDYISVLSAAQGLPEPDRLRLIDALWETVSPDLEAPFSDEWTHEIERRAAELDTGTAKTIPWPQIREEARRLSKEAGYASNLDGTWKSDWELTKAHIDADCKLSEEVIAGLQFLMGKMTVRY